MVLNLFAFVSYYLLEIGLTNAKNNIGIITQFGCFESCQFRSRSVFFVS